MSVYLTVKQIIKSPERALNDIVLDPFTSDKKERRARLKVKFFVAIPAIKRAAYKFCGIPRVREYYSQNILNNLRVSLRLFFYLFIYFFFWIKVVEIYKFNYVLALKLIIWECIFSHQLVT